MPNKVREWTPVERQQVITLRKEGYSWRLIHQRTGIPKSSAFEIWGRYQDSQSVVSKPRPGRPRKVTEKVKDSITAIIKKQRSITSKEISKKLPKRIRVSAASIRKVRASMGWTSSMGNPRENLTDKHKAARLRWCKKYQNTNFNYWIWSDEKPFELFKSRRRVWRLPGEPVPIVPTMKYPPKLTLWAAVGRCGSSTPAVWQGRKNSQHYINTLEKHLIPFINRYAHRRYTFQQDRDTTHTSRITKDWCTRLNIMKYTPAKSPDLNPIELLWNIIEPRVMARNPQTKAQLKRFVKEEWGKLTQDEIDKCIDHVISLIPQIIEANGDYVEVTRKR